MPNWLIPLEIGFFMGIVSCKLVETWRVFRINRNLNRFANDITDNVENQASFKDDKQSGNSLEQYVGETLSRFFGARAYISLFLYDMLAAGFLFKELKRKRLNVMVSSVVSKMLVINCHEFIDNLGDVLNMKFQISAFLLSASGGLDPAEEIVNLRKRLKNLHRTVQPYRQHFANARNEFGAHRPTDIGNYFKAIESLDEKAIAVVITEAVSLANDVLLFQSHIMRNVRRYIDGSNH